MCPLLINAFRTVFAFLPALSFCFLCHLSPCAHSISPFVSFFLAYSLTHFCLRETLAYYIVCFTMKFWFITLLSSVATFFSDAKCWVLGVFFVNHYVLFSFLSYIFWLDPMLVQFWLLCLRRVFPERQGEWGEGGGLNIRCCIKTSSELKVLGWCSFWDRGLGKYLSASSKTEQWQIIWKGCSQEKMFSCTAPLPSLHSPGEWFSL